MERLKSPVLTIIFLLYLHAVIVFPGLILVKHSYDERLTFKVVIQIFIRIRRELITGICMGRKEEWSEEE